MREWYLLENKSYLSGFNGEDFENNSQQAFMESLETPIATDVEIYNSDLSEKKEIRAIVQGRTQDTKLNSLTRTILTPIGTCKAGMYVKYKGNFWLIVGYVDNNGIYEKCALVICNYLLSWLNRKGEVVQRWCYVLEASQYNNGETSTTNVTFRTDQILVSLPIDNECLEISQGQRFIIDVRCKVYERNIGQDIKICTDKKVITYNVTRVGNVIFDYGEDGVFEIMMTQDEQHNEDGYYVIGNKGYWLCMGEENNIQDGNKTIISSCYIECESTEIYNGLEPVVFTAVFYDNDGNKDDSITPVWNIDCDVKDKLKIEYADNSVLVSVNSIKAINKIVTISLSAEGYETYSTTAIIKDLL